MVSTHRCPNWCHKCPDMIEIIKGRGDEDGGVAALADPVETTMPVCMGGVQWGLDGCHCYVNVERDRRREDRGAALERLRCLIEAYPREASKMVAALPELTGSGPT